MIKNPPKDSHHHGNLREALITAGLELLEQDGPTGLTLRKCAALAGVSHAAPANHFNGLISLKVSIIARGHTKFAKAMRKSSKQADASPQAQLNAICDGYISFARSNTGLFKFMFQPLGETLGDVDTTSMDEKNQAAASSYDILHQACIPFEHKKNDPLNTETMIWSLVHGYSMLFAGDKITAPSDLVIPSFADILPDLQLR